MISEKSAALESTTPLPADAPGAILAASVSTEVISRVAIHQLRRFLRWLADTPDAMRLDRYREADGPDDYDGTPMCATCLALPAYYQGRCASCNANQS